MGIHYVNWISTASGVEDFNIHADSLAWVVGDSDAVQIEQTKSYHGSPIYMIRAEIKNKSKARKSLARLGSPTLQRILDEIDSRIDDNNVIHIRLDMKKLLSGNIEISAPDCGFTIKGRAKLEVYPGSSAKDVAIGMLEELIDLANKNNLPEKLTLE